MELKITMQEYGILRNALVKRPFEEIASLVVKLDNQIVEQQKAQQTEKQTKGAE